jgi:GMC oxidoreductase
MQSGVCDQAELQRFGIPVVQHLPRVGHGFQDHPVVVCIWEYPAASPGPMCEFVLILKRGNPDQTTSARPCAGSGSILTDRLCRA